MMLLAVAVLMGPFIIVAGASLKDGEFLLAAVALGCAAVVGLTL